MNMLALLLFLKKIGWVYKAKELSANSETDGPIK